MRSASRRRRRLQAEKRAKAIQEKEAAGPIVCAPDAVAWLFNIRGHDVLHTPMPLVRAYVPADGQAVLFTSLGHLTPENKKVLGQIAQISPIGRVLSKMLPGLIQPGAKV